MSRSAMQVLSPPALVQRDGPRYSTRNVAALGSALDRAGWRPGELKSSREAARFWRNGALILIYLTGAVVVGGRHFWSAADTLARLCPEPADMQLQLFDEVLA